MRLAFKGDYAECQRWLGRAQQEIYRLKLRMDAERRDEGQFGPMQFAPGVSCFGRIQNGIESVLIEVEPTASTTSVAAYFEFGTSGFPLKTWSGTLDGNSFTAYDGAVVSVFLGLGEKTLRSRAKIATSIRHHQLKDASAVRRVFRPNLLDRTAYYRTSGYLCATQTNLFSGIYDQSINAERPRGTNTELGSEQAFGLRDDAYDAPFEVGQGTAKALAAMLRGDADWPRNAGVQIVDGVKYVVYVDANCTVWSFPLAESALTDDFVQNVPIDGVHSAPIPMPGWAFINTGRAVDTVDSGWLASPDIAWKISPDGTRICAVLHERESATFDTAYIDDPDTNFGANPFRPSFPAKGSITFSTGTRYLFYGQTDGGELGYTFGRGVFEAAVTLTPGGAISISGTDIRTPRGSDRGTYMVDYAARDIGAIGVKAGDMILLDIERWYQPNESIVDPSAPVAGNWDLRVVYGRPLSVEFPPFAPHCNDGPDPDHPDFTLSAWCVGPGGSLPPPGFYGWHPSNGDPVPPELADADPNLGESGYESTPNINNAHVVRFDPSEAGSRSMADWLDENADNAELPADLRAGFHGSAEALRAQFTERFVTGKTASFFSLRKRRGDSETEILAIVGDALLAVALTSCSLVVAVEYEQTVNRTLAAASDTPSDKSTTWFGWPESVTMPYRISHPGVAIYTQGRLREVLMPDGADTAVVKKLNALARIAPRAQLDDSWRFMPANDLRDWTADDLGALRDFQLFLNDWSVDYPERIRDSNPLQHVSIQTRNWWLAMCVNSSLWPMLLFANPNFGWLLYASEIIKKTQNAKTTFFVHPNGSWAYYDANRIYNTFGVPDIFRKFTADNADDTSGKYTPNNADHSPRNAFHYSNMVPLTYFDDSGIFVEPPAAYTQMYRFVRDDGGPMPMTAVDVADVPCYVDIPPGEASAVQTTVQSCICQSGAFFEGASANTIEVYILSDTFDTFDVTHDSTGIRLTARVDVKRVVNSWLDFDSLNPMLTAIANGAMKHQIFDRIHIEKIDQSGRVLNTRFADQYNAAVKKLTDQPVGEELTQMTAANQRATFSAEMVGLNESIQLNVQWPAGHSWSYTDAAYRDKFRGTRGYYSDARRSAPGAGAFLKLRLDGVAATPPFSGSRRVTSFPPTFSTCLLLA